MKNAVKDELRTKLNGIAGIEWCWIERARKIRKTEKYNFVIRISAGEVPLGALDEISRLFKTGAVSVESGYEMTGCCELCSGTESYLEIDIGDATLPN
jgi:hypothetical protein